MALLQLLFFMITTPKMAIALALLLIAVYPHMIPEFNANEWRHAFVPHVTQESY